MISNRLRIEEHNGKKIIVVDYTGLKEKGMIELLHKHQELALKTKLHFLGDFHKTYATPGFMRQAKLFVEATRPVTDKAGLLGVDKIKSYILKGILLVYKVNYKAFDSREKAIEFLTLEK